MKKVRRTIDILMVAVLLLLMAYSLIGEDVHEVLGIGMFTLFLMHQIIHRKWWMMLFHGKYNAVRILDTTVNLLLAAFMILQPISGVLMSKHVLTEVTIEGAAGTLRMIHMTIVYWGFLLMGFHLGLHVRPMVSGIKKHLSKSASVFVFALLILIAVYGVYAFIDRGVGDYMLMKVMFAYFDYNEPRILFLLDYATIVVLAALVGYWTQSGLLAIGKRRKTKAADGEQYGGLQK